MEDSPNDFLTETTEGLVLVGDLNLGSTLNPTFKIIYHQKKIKNFENGSYDNISLGIGFTIF